MKSKPHPGEILRHMQTKFVETLIFNEGEDCEFPREPKCGTVGCFSADRVPDWNLFVVTDFDAEKKEMTVVYPRMRYNALTENVEIGQDASATLFTERKTCVCERYHGCDGFCHCGAAESNSREYKSTFKCATSSTSYAHCKIPFVRGDGYVFFSHLRKTEVFDEKYKPDPIRF